VTAHDIAFDLEPQPVYPHGPFDEVPRVSLGRDLHRDLRRRLLLQALDGIELGAWDHQILDWLSMWEPSTLLTIAGWIWRAKAGASAAPPPLGQGSDGAQHDCHGDPGDPVRYDSVTPPPASPVAQRRCPVCGAEPASSRATFCSDKHRQLAFRQRQSAPPPPPRRPPRHQVVYQCPTCEERFLGLQRCEGCNTFCRRLGVGALCVHCDQPVALSDLLTP
jgi:hypothetical protein